MSLTTGVRSRERQDGTERKHQAPYPPVPRSHIRPESRHSTEAGFPAVRSGHLRTGHHTDARWRGLVRCLRKRHGRLGELVLRLCRSSRALRLSASRTN